MLTPPPEFINAKNNIEILPLGQLPVLHIEIVIGGTGTGTGRGGRVVSQRSAILRYFGKLVGGAALSLFS